MGAPIMGDFFKSQEEKKEIQRIEQLKKLGRTFIRVRYLGGGQMPRIHGTYGVRAYPYTDISGKQEWKTAEESAVLEFQEDSVGALVADVLDCEYNRFWLSRHLPPSGELEIDEPAVKREIAALSKKEFKVEVSKLDQLKRDKERLDREIATEEAVEGEPTEVSPEEPVVETPEADEPPTPAPEQEPPKRPRGRPPKAKRKEDSDRLNDEV